MQIGKAAKSTYIGVYKRPKGSRPWITCIRFLDRMVLVHSTSERIAGIKYNALANFFQGDTAKLNDIKVPAIEYRMIVKELFFQLTAPTGEQKTISNQGLKKYTVASTQYVGVYKYPGKELYQAYINKKGKRYSLGYFKSSIEGAAAYNIAAPILYG